MWYKLFFFSLIGILISSCGSKSPSPLIEPGILSIAFTPAAAHFAPDFNRCANSLESTAIIAIEVPANNLSLHKADLAIRWGSPPLENSEAFVIFEDRLVMITHPDYPVESLTLTELVSLYTGNGSARQMDIEPENLYLFAYPEGSDIDQAFLNFINAPRINSPAIRIVPHPAAMIQAVSENNHAVGSIPLSALNSSVREISILDLPDKADVVQVLAMTGNSPTAVQMGWLHCLQIGLSE